MRMGQVNVRPVSDGEYRQDRAGRFGILPRPSGRRSCGLTN
jgi:hypothetical protein